MLYYFYIAAITNFIFGLTDATIRLETIQNVDSNWFLASNIISAFIVYTISEIVTKDGIKQWVWDHKKHLLIIDVVLYGVICLLTPISYNIRFLALSTVSLVSAQLLSVLWEYVKELSRNGVVLDAKKTSKETLGWVIGAITYLVANNYFQYELTLIEALAYQFSIIIIDASAFYMVMKKLTITPEHTKLNDQNFL